MKAGGNLLKILKQVDWSQNISQFSNDPNNATRLTRISRLIALWSVELEVADKGNLALSFIREAQAAGHYVGCLIPLALYKPAAASMRAIIDCVLQYSYFRQHPAELATLGRDSRFFMDKKEILEHHRLHTLNFGNKQQALGLNTRLDKWYSEMSAIIHGQVPGQWVTHKKLSDIAFDREICELGISKFEEAGEIFRRVLLCTVERSSWYCFTKESKREFLKGIKGEHKNVLELTLA